MTTIMRSSHTTPLARGLDRLDPNVSGSAQCRSSSTNRHPVLAPNNLSSRTTASPTSNSDGAGVGSGRGPSSTRSGTDGQGVQGSRLAPGCRGLPVTDSLGAALRSVVERAMTRPPVLRAPPGPPFPSPWRQLRPLGSGGTCPRLPRPSAPSDIRGPRPLPHRGALAEPTHRFGPPEWGTALTPPLDQRCAPSAIRARLRSGRRLEGAAASTWSGHRRPANSGQVAIWKVFLSRRHPSRARTPHVGCPGVAISITLRAVARSEPGATPW